MGNTESFRSVADRFGISKSSLRRNVTHVIEAFLLVAEDFINWPATEFQRQAISSCYQRIPGVIGCVDGTYIPMAGKSGVKRDAYICRKGFPAMHAQLTCTHKLLITDITTGFPGSAHDARVFRNSSLYTHLQSLPPQYHVLGDSAYPLETFMLTPFKDNGHLSPTEKKFNYVQSSTRCCVERCTGLLKAKFGKLKFFDARDDTFMCTAIVACAVVHNFLIRKETVDESDIIIDWQDAVNEGAESRVTSDALNKRLDIAASLCV